MCDYDVWYASPRFKTICPLVKSILEYLNDFEPWEFNMLLGSNIGYGGTKFNYDPSKSY